MVVASLALPNALIIIVWKKEAWLNIPRKLDMEDQEKVVGFTWADIPENRNNLLLKICF